MAKKPTDFTDEKSLVEEALTAAKERSQEWSESASSLANETGQIMTERDQLDSKFKALQDELKYRDEKRRDISDKLDRCPPHLLNESGIAEAMTRLLGEKGYDPKFFTREKKGTEDHFIVKNPRLLNQAREIGQTMGVLVFSPKYDRVVIDAVKLKEMIQPLFNDKNTQVAIKDRPAKIEAMWEPQLAADEDRLRNMSGYFQRLVEKADALHVRALR